MSDFQQTAKVSVHGRVRETVRHIARELEQEAIAPGDRAAMRRIRPGEIGGPAFWKVAIRYLEPAGLLADADSSLRRRQELYWSTILASMAEGPPFGARSLGRALADAGVTEARVLRLLRAQDDALLDAARTVAHQLAAQGSEFDWSDMVELLSSDSAPHAEAVRRRIAYDYYRQEQVSGHETKEEK